MTREEIRKAMKEQRNKLSINERIRMDKALYEHWLHSAGYGRGKCVFTYVSFDAEADTHAILLQALADHKKVFVPRVSGAAMEFYQIHSLHGLVPNHYGIPEPDGLEANRFKAKHETTTMAETAAGAKAGTKEEAAVKAGTIYPDYERVMLLPGLAFDRQGNRIGYGKGFYDRYLAGFPKGYFYKIALAYDFQIVGQITSEEYDRRVDLILTPSGCIDCSGSGSIG